MKDQATNWGRRNSSAANELRRAVVSSPTSFESWRVDGLVAVERRSTFGKSFLGTIHLGFSHALILSLPSMTVEKAELN